MYILTYLGSIKDGKVTYDSVNQMKYMSLCISETQRMYTVALGDRRASTDFEYNGIKIKKDQVVYLLYYTMSHDETVFPEADKFKPERERPVENYLPFGSGPRNCIAQRFALIEMKLLMATILSQFRFEKCEKTIVNELFLIMFYLKVDKFKFLHHFLFI